MQCQRDLPRRHTRPDVLFLETGVLLKNLFLGHAVGQPAEKSSLAAD